MHALKCAGANLELYRLELGGSTVVNNTLPSTHTWFYYLNKNYSLNMSLQACIIYLCVHHRALGL